MLWLPGAALESGTSAARQSATEANLAGLLRCPLLRQLEAGSACSHPCQLLPFLLSAAFSPSRYEACLGITAVYLRRPGGLTARRSLARSWCFSARHAAATAGSSPPQRSSSARQPALLFRGRAPVAQGPQHRGHGGGLHLRKRPLHAHGDPRALPRRHPEELDGERDRVLAPLRARRQGGCGGGARRRQRARIGRWGGGGAAGAGHDGAADLVEEFVERARVLEELGREAESLPHAVLRRRRAGRSALRWRAGGAAGGEAVWAPCCGGPVGQGERLRASGVTLGGAPSPIACGAAGAGRAGSARAPNAPLRKAFRHERCSRHPGNHPGRPGRRRRRAPRGRS